MVLLWLFHSHVVVFLDVRLPLPPYSFGIPKKSTRKTLMDIACGKEVPGVRLSVLRVGHVASLAAIVDAWSVQSKMNKNILLKSWSGMLFPLDNQPSGAVHMLGQMFTRVGNRFIHYRTKQFRSNHVGLAKVQTVWKTAALKQSRKKQAAKKW